MQEIVRAEKNASESLRQLEQMFTSSQLTADTVSEKAREILQQITNIKSNIDGCEGAAQMDPSILLRLENLEKQAALYANNADTFVISHRVFAENLAKMRLNIEEFQKNIAACTTISELERLYQDFQTCTNEFLTSCAPVDIKSSQKAFSILSMFSGPKLTIEQEIQQAAARYEDKKTVLLRNMRPLTQEEMSHFIANIREGVSVIVAQHEEFCCTSCQALTDLGALKAQLDQKREAITIFYYKNLDENLQDTFDALNSAIERIESKIKNQYINRIEAILNESVPIESQLVALHALYTELLAFENYKPPFPQTTKEQSFSLARDLLNLCENRCKEVLMRAQTSPQSSSAITYARELLKGLDQWSSLWKSETLTSIQGQTQSCLSQQAKEIYRTELFARLEELQQQHARAEALEDKQTVRTTLELWRDQSLRRMDELGFSHEEKELLQSRQREVLLTMYDDTCKQIRREYFQTHNLLQKNQLTMGLQRLTDEALKRLAEFPDHLAAIQEFTQNSQILSAYIERDIDYVTARKMSNDSFLQNECYRIACQVEELLEAYHTHQDSHILVEIKKVRDKFEKFANRFGFISANVAKFPTSIATEKTESETQEILANVLSNDTKKAIQLVLDDTDRKCIQAKSSASSVRMTSPEEKSWHRYIEEGSCLLEKADRDFQKAGSWEMKAQIRAELKQKYDSDYRLRVPKDVPASENDDFQENMDKINRFYDAFCLQTAQTLFQVSRPSPVILREPIPPLIELSQHRQLTESIKYGSLKDVIVSRSFSDAPFTVKQRMWPEIIERLQTIDFFREDPDLRAVLVRRDEEAIECVSFYLLALRYQSLEGYRYCKDLPIGGHQSLASIAEEYHGATLNPDLLSSMEPGRTKNVSFQLQQIQATEEVKGIVKIKDDGNGYYRGIMYGYLKEVMQLSNAERKSILDELYGTMSSIYPQLPESEHESYLQFMSFLKEAANNPAIAQRFDEYLLLEDSPLDRGMIMSYRYALADWIRTGGNFYIVPSKKRGSPRILGDSLASYAQNSLGLDASSGYSSTERYLSEIVQCWGRDAQGPIVDLSIGAVVLNCKMTMSELDVTQEQFISPFSVGVPSARICVKTLLRSGYYDILYGSWNRERPEPRI